VNKTWRHLNFFEHECYLHCRTPRIQLPNQKVRLVSPPWAGLNSGFTLLFEALILQLCTSMPVLAVARLIHETDDKLWRLLDSYIEQALEFEDYSEVCVVGMDETSRSKGHDYISLFVDMKEKRTIFIAQGKDHKTVESFSKHLLEHKGDPQKITDVSCDMSPAFIKGVRENLPLAEITFDKFHILKIINEAVDQVRREEVALKPLLKGGRYIFLKNNEKLTAKQQETLKMLKMPKWKLKTIRALHIRENFQEIYKAVTENEFELLLKKWYFWATHSRLEPMKKAAKTIKAHWDGVLSWKRSQINNGILEGLNSVIQAIKSKARGFATFNHYRTIIYLTTGKLNLNLINPKIEN